MPCYKTISKHETEKDLILTNEVGRTCSFYPDLYNAGAYSVQKLILLLISDVRNNQNCNEKLRFWGKFVPFSPNLVQN